MGGFICLPKGLAGSRAPAVPPSGNPEGMRWWWTPTTSGLFKCPVMHNGSLKQIHWYWWKLAQSHYCCFLSLPSNPWLILETRSCCFSCHIYLLSGLSWVYSADLFLGLPNPTWPSGAGLPIYPFLTAHLYLGHPHRTCRCSTETIGNRWSSGVTAGSQMLCPTVLKMLWGQFNPMQNSFLGLSTHPSCELCPSLPSSPPSSLAWPGLSRPSTWQRASFGSHSPANSHDVSASSTANSVSVRCNHWICLCVRVLGAAPLLDSKIQHQQNIFEPCNPMALTFVPLPPAKYPIFSLIQSPLKSVKNLTFRDSLVLEISEMGMNFSSLSAEKGFNSASIWIPWPAGLGGYSHRAPSP